MSCQLHLKLAGGLIRIARAMRVLKRYGIEQSRVWIEREGSTEIANVKGTLRDPQRSLRLTEALSRIPGMLEAVVSHDDASVAAFYCAGWTTSLPPRGARTAAPKKSDHQPEWRQHT